MKKSKVCLSVMLIIVILIISATSAVAVKTNRIAPEEKISQGLFDAMERAERNELIKTWVWLTDIDHSEAAHRIERATGYSEDEIHHLVSDNDFVELATLLGNTEENDNGENRKSQLISDKQSVVQQVKEKNKEKRELVKAYRKGRIGVYDSMYTAHNNKIIDSLGLDRERINFICSLTPSFIVELSSTEINYLVESDLVIDMGLCPDSEIVEDYSVESNEETITEYTYVSNAQRGSMHADIGLDCYGYTGEDINILMIGGREGYISISDYSNLNMVNPETVENVFNQQSYPITDTNHLPADHSEHTAYCTRVLKEMSPDSHVYVTKPLEFSDILYTIENKEINLINISMGYSAEYGYDEYAKWFDTITSICRLPLIASIGNRDNEMYGYPNVITPANGYNSIAVGSYIVDENSLFEDDELYDCRYNPVTGFTLATYKPDVVVASGSTSSAAPILTGILSWALEMNYDLLDKPQAVKAIVLASVHRKAKHAPGTNDLDEDIHQGLTQKQGAGIVDAFNILKTSAYLTYGTIQLTPDFSTVTTDIESPVSIMNYGTVAYNDDLNVSTAWYVNFPGMQLSDINQLGNTSYPTTHHQDINLELLDGNTVKSSSTRINSGKQMVYIDDADENQTYQIRVENVSPVADMESVEVGYAWSERGYRELSGVTLNGDLIQGSTLQATAKKRYRIITSYFYENVDPSEVTYIWERSLDGDSWETINVIGSSYTLTAADCSKYIRCTVNPRTTSLLGNSIVSVTTANAVASS